MRAKSEDIFFIKPRARVCIDEEFRSEVFVVDAVYYDCGKRFLHIKLLSGQPFSMTTNKWTNSLWVNRNQLVSADPRNIVKRRKKHEC